MICQILNLDNYHRFIFYFSINHLKIIKHNMPRYRDFLTNLAFANFRLNKPIHNLVRRSVDDHQYAVNSRKFSANFLKKFSH